MFNNFKDTLKNMFKSRVFILVIVFLFLSFLVVQRVFNLQIVKGKSYLENYVLQTEKERTLPSTRGNIYDRNGELLAYNELTRSVMLEDIGAYANSQDGKKAWNTMLYDLIQVIEKNGDRIINDFNVIVNASGEYEFSLQDRQLLRFIADVYGKKKIEDLSEKQQSATAQDIINYLTGSNRFNIDKSAYTKEEIIKIVTIRYNLSQNSYKKYIPITVARGIKEETVAVVMENKDKLPGVSIHDETMRKYVDSNYFANIIGYTGRISVEEMEELSKENSTYEESDIIGKLGIEKVMETTLQGTKGKEKVFVDSVGKIIDNTDRTEPQTGNNVYLTIDKNLQMVTYKLLEQKLAGILVNKIQDTKNYKPSETMNNKDMIIPFDDVLFALLNNNVIDIKHFASPDATATEQQTAAANAAEVEEAIQRIVGELQNTNASSHESLDDEMQDYLIYIAEMLKTDELFDKDKIDTSDETYIAWRDKKISFREYLYYAISKNWISASKMQAESQYSDSEEVFKTLLNYIQEKLISDPGFQKKVYKYMIHRNQLSGTDLCLILLEQNLLPFDQAEYDALRNGAIGAQAYLMDKIENIQITPAQLALEPCSGSCVVTDVNTGEVLAAVSYPNYDNNRLANTVDSNYYNKLATDLSSPFINRISQQSTAPGSTFKMVAAAAGLEEGVISSDELIKDEIKFSKLGGKAPQCWYAPNSHGLLNVTGAIENSCNYFFYETGYRLSSDGTGYQDKLGIEKLKKYASMFGFDSKSGIELPEAEPRISDQFPVPSAIGQGTNNFTNVQLARYVAAIANNGKLFNLSLIEQITDVDGKVIQDYKPQIVSELNFSQSTWDSIHNGMRKVVEKSDAFKDLNVNLAGKTGTAQENKLRANHSLFVAYAPFEAPEIGITVQIANGYTSGNAADLTKNVTSYYYEQTSFEDVMGGTAITTQTEMGD